MTIFSTKTILTRALLFITMPLMLTNLAMAQSYMLVGNDEKFAWDEQGNTQLLADEGKDTVSIFDISTNPKTPKLIKNLPLNNSLAGPPVNMVITPDNKLALVANSLTWVKKEGKWGGVPDNKLYLIDLSNNPQANNPQVIDRLTVDQQPSGMDLNPKGDLLLIANRADSKISVVKIVGKTAKLIDSVEVGKKTAAVSFTPDGKRAFFIAKKQNKVGILHIEGDKVSYDAAQDINVGIAPYNIVVSPKGGIALVNNIGVTGGNDGNVDSVSVIDIDAKHPHVIDSIAVGDGPEGLAISPNGDLAVSVLINGSQNAHAKEATKWAYHPNGRIAVLKIDGKKVKKISEFEVGGMPEGVVFNPNGKYFYVGNFTTDDISIFEVDGDKVKNTGKRLKLAGSPASMRGSKR